MAIINTEDKYIQDIIKIKPEYADMLTALSEEKDKWIYRYGKPVIGSYQDMQVDEDAEIIKGVKQISIDLLKTLQKICDSHGLRLFLIYGTLLGAVRSDGIIPGDDDIDVALPREDYNKLMELGNEIVDPYFLQTMTNDNCFYGGYAKLRRKDTTAINPQNWWVDCCEGIGIDIFPLDNGFISKAREISKKRQIKHIQRLLYAKTYGYFRSFKDMPLLVWKGYKYVGKLFSKDKLIQRLNDIMAKGDTSIDAPYGVYTHYMGEGNGRFTTKKAFAETMTMRYEGVELLAPKDWDRVLSDFYGDSYLSPIPLSKNRLRHAFYNVDVPYSNYKKRFSGLYRPGPSTEQKIVLVGDRLMFQAYLNRYTDARKKPWKMISMDALDELRDIKSENIYLIICGYDIRAIENDIRTIGFRDYYIFCYYREWIQYANNSVIEDELKKALEID